MDVCGTGRKIELESWECFFQSEAGKKVMAACRNRVCVDHVRDARLSPTSHRK